MLKPWLSTRMSAMGSPSKTEPIAKRSPK
jgi:hypothetical protein